MFVVVIHGWQQETPELAQALADALGILAFEARQRLIGGGPAVVASFADSRQAEAAAQKVIHNGIAALVFNATALRSQSGCLVVRRCELDDRALKIETDNGQQATIPYEEVDLLLAATSIVGYSATKTVTDRKISIGQTVLAGGIPIFKKVESKEEVSSEERGRIIYLYAGDRPKAVFTQNGMSYDGFGAAMKLSRELNFTYLTSQLRLLCTAARYDDRLLSKSGQVRLLGTTLNPESNLHIAVDILARCLRAS